MFSPSLASATELNVTLISEGKQLDFKINDNSDSWAETNINECRYTSRVTSLSQTVGAIAPKQGFLIEAYLDCLYSNGASSHYILPEIVVSKGGEASISIGEEPHHFFYSINSPYKMEE